MTEANAVCSEVVTRSVRPPVPERLCHRLEPTGFDRPSVSKPDAGNTAHPATISDPGASLCESFLSLPASGAAPRARRGLDTVAPSNGGSPSKSSLLLRNEVPNLRRSHAGSRQHDLQGNFEQRGKQLSVDIAISRNG